MMAECSTSPVTKLCFYCEKNPRVDGDVVCISCKEEHDRCYECGKRRRNHPFYLCTPCYQAQRRRQSAPATAAAKSLPAVAPSVSSKTSPKTQSPRAASVSSLSPPKLPLKSARAVDVGSARLSRGPAQDHEAEQISTCILPGCSKPQYVDKLSGYVHDFCGKTHADEYKQMYRAFPPRKDVEQTVNLLRLDKSQNTYKELEKFFKKEWVKTSEAFPNPPDISAIYAIQNGWQVEQFRRYSSEIRQTGSASNSGRFFHGTTILCNLLGTNECCSDTNCGVCGISRNGFDSSKIGSNIPRFKRFGHGIYLAPNSSKCHDYTQGMPEHGYRAQLLCLVACGAKCELLWNDTKLVEPPESFHSVHGKSGGNLNYDEIVVYDVNAVQPQYVVVYERDGVNKIAQ